MTSFFTIMFGEGAIWAYLIIGLVLYVLITAGELDKDLLDSDRWKRIYRILFRLSIVLFWMVYIIAIAIAVAVAIIVWIVKQFLKFFD